MKKKGFTLIELLGVIIVLAIIALIAVPTILGVIDKARKGSLKNSAYGLIEAANLYYAQYGVSNTERFNLEEENELKYKGEVESGTVLLNSKGKVMICINDSGNAAYKNYNDNEVVVVSGKTCNVNTSETQILLDGENTIGELTNQELTQEIENLRQEINILRKENSNSTNDLSNQIVSLNDLINKTKESTVSINEIYHVGSIYISTNNIDPSNLFKGTSWEIYGKNRMLLSVDTSEKSGQIGGNNKVTLSIDNLPNHNHNIPSLNGTTSLDGYHTHMVIGSPTGGSYSLLTDSGYHTGTVMIAQGMTESSGSGSHNHTLTTDSSTTDSVGNGASFDIQNPYITVYIWKRIS